MFHIPITNREDRYNGEVDDEPNGPSGFILPMHPPMRMMATTTATPPTTATTTMTNNSCSFVQDHSDHQEETMGNNVLCWPSVGGGDGIAMFGSSKTRMIDPEVVEGGMMVRPTTNKPSTFRNPSEANTLDDVIGFHQPSNHPIVPPPSFLDGHDISIVRRLDAPLSSLSLSSSLISSSLSGMRRRGEWKDHPFFVHDDISPYPLMTVGNGNGEDKTTTKNNNNNDDNNNLLPVTPVSTQYTASSSMSSTIREEIIRTFLGR